MNTAPRVLVCTQYDTEAGTCVTQEWAYVTPLLPPLSAADGALLGSLLLGCWGLAYVFRKLEQVVRQ